MEDKMNKKHCEGCEDNFYNGNNQYDIKECWCLKKAKLVMKKKVHINQTPPWKQKPIKVPDCYKVKKYVFISGEREK